MSEFGFDPGDPSTRRIEGPNPESRQFDRTDTGDMGRYLASLASQVEDGPISASHDNQRTPTQDGVEEANYPDGEDDGRPEEFYEHPGRLAD